MMKQIHFMNGGKFISRGRGRHPTRTIDSTELILVISGKLSIFEAENEFCVKEGEFLFLYPDRLHGGLADYPKNLSFFWGHFRAGKRQMAPFPQYGCAARPESFSEYFELLLAEQRVRDNARTCDLLLELLLNETIRSQGPREAEQSRLAEEARRIIRLRFSDNISTSDIARELGCNADHLGRVFHHNYGMSVVDALNEARVENCAKLLRSGTGSIKEIAYSCGFNDTAYFRRRFFHRFSLRPSQYRKLHSNIKINTE
ncbi:MAG: HTH-type transcriptional regulator YesS [Lentisphaerae bacterium ADurb.Bin242]|nr:MAG: HTH-type transcriptional regulator YesS [Lentisphaerae bacterium ADurb.Bin242]